ncbi:MAG: recombination mediator RecR [Vulcanimicrobiota bacterium]
MTAQKVRSVYQHPAPIQRLCESLMRLPGIGPKTAQRLAYHLLDAPLGEVQEMVACLQSLRQDVGRCRTCGNFSQAESCALCTSERRDRSLLCVVAQARDIVAFERTGEYRGLYHVLGGLLSPMDGRGPDQLNLEALLKRIESENFQEVVLATDPTVAGEATALYLEQLLEGFSGTVSRLALGIPVGTDFEYTDDVTLGRALSYRQRVKGRE